ncbi:MAG: ABC transporter ATP-binding protein [Candidatus Pacearchaeota archaeon]|nr:ABC transporter ATP-binding protein [Candidatus Pacearchaeota archaeon]
MDEIIKLEEVWKIYNEGEENQVIALKNINLHVKRGDFIAVMGPSGSGKSTGMNLIGSLDIPSHGKIFLDQHNISHLSESDLAQVRGKKIGFIFQQFNLIPNLTAKENVMLPMIFQEMDEIERIIKAESLLKMMELGDRMDHYPSELSGGQQQRVAIARALANDPEVILADEPTGNLDTHTGEVVMKFLNKLNNEGKTIIIVTHDPDLALEHSKKIYWIKDGQIERVTEKIKDKWKTLKKTPSK